MGGKEFYESRGSQQTGTTHLCGGGVPSSHPSLGLSVFFLSFFGSITFPPSAHSSPLGPSLAHVEGWAPCTARTATAAEAMGEPGGVSTGRQARTEQ